MSEMMVTKVTLSTKKTVFLRDMKIRDTEIAAKAAAPRSGGDATVLQLCMQSELVKLLIVAIDEKPVKPEYLEDLDSQFSMREYAELMTVIRKLTDSGEGSPVNPPIEVVSFGGK